jgi:hypothetical protein
MTVSTPAKEALTMATRESRHAIITVDIDTGEVTVKGDEGSRVSKVTTKDLEKIYRSKDGFKFIGTILQSHSSARCVYFIGGKWVKVC